MGVPTSAAPFTYCACEATSPGWFWLLADILSCDLGEKREVRRDLIEFRFDVEEVVGFRAKLNCSRAYTYTTS